MAPANRWESRPNRNTFMSQFPGVQYRERVLGYAADDKVVSRFFNAVYAWMAVGLAVTAVVAWYVSRTPAALQMIYGTPLKWVLWLGMFGLAMGVSAAAMRLSATAGT